MVTHRSYDSGHDGVIRLADGRSRIIVYIKPRVRRRWTRTLLFGATPVAYDITSPVALLIVAREEAFVDALQDMLNRDDPLMVCVLYDGTDKARNSLQRVLSDLLRNVATEEIRRSESG